MLGYSREGLSDDSLEIKGNNELLKVICTLLYDLVHCRCMFSGECQRVSLGLVIQVNNIYRLNIFF